MFSSRPDPGLQRFVSAQEPVYAQALAELRAGRKRSHWMWFVFPQISGLGRSDTARYYAVADRAEAVAYLEHPVLGARLRECCAALAELPPSADAETVLGPVDAVKLRSSLTLFAAVSSGPAFESLLARYFPDDGPDPLTLARLGGPERRA